MQLPPRRPCSCFITSRWRGIVFWCYGDRPYPPLPSEIAQRVLPDDGKQPGRVLWIGPWRSGLPGFSWLLPYSLPSAYGAGSFIGYDPIIENRPETRAIQAHFDDSPVEAARAYGIHWILEANPDHYWPERDYWQSVRKSDWCFDYMEGGLAQPRGARAAGGPVALPARRAAALRAGRRMPNGL